MKKYLLVFGASLIFFFIVFGTSPEVETVEPQVSSVPPVETVNSGDILKLVNEYRVENKLDILYIDKELCVDSDLRLEETKINWTHDGFYDLEVITYLGENLAVDFETSKQVVNGWKRSPLHDKNLLDPKFIYTCISTDGNYVVQLYSADNK